VVVVHAGKVVVHEVRATGAREGAESETGAALVHHAPSVGALEPGLAEMLEDALQQTDVVHHRRRG